jgi:hypothetical protein
MAASEAPIDLGSNRRDGVKASHGPEIPARENSVARLRRDYCNGPPYLFSIYFRRTNPRQMAAQAVVSPRPATQRALRRSLKRPFDVAS